MVHSTCPKCGEKFDFEPRYAGKKAKCNACEFVFILPPAPDTNKSPEPIQRPIAAPRPRVTQTRNPAPPPEHRGAPSSGAQKKRSTGLVMAALGITIGIALTLGAVWLFVRQPVTARANAPAALPVSIISDFHASVLQASPLKLKVTLRVAPGSPVGDPEGCAWVCFGGGTYLERLSAGLIAGKPKREQVMSLSNFKVGYCAVRFSLRQIDADAWEREAEIRDVDLAKATKETNIPLGLLIVSDEGQISNILSSSFVVSPARDSGLNAANPAPSSDTPRVPTERAEDDVWPTAQDTPAALPGTSGAMWVVVGNPTPAIKACEVSLSLPKEVDAASASQKRVFPPGTKNLYLACKFASIPRDARISFSVKNNAGAVPINAGVMISDEDNRTGTFTVTRSITSAKGEFPVGSYQASVLVNSVPVALVNWIVGPDRP